MTELEYAIENILPGIESGLFVSGEIVFDALELSQSIKPRTPLSKLVDIFKPLAVGDRQVHIREESDQPTIVLGSGKVKHLEHFGPVARYVVSWFDIPKPKEE